MNKTIKNIIEETFKSKAQQRLFYAKSSDMSLPTKDRKKWGKWADEFSDKTDFKKIPQKIKKTKKDVDEIVDELGNISRNKRPTDLSTKGVTDNHTTDQVRTMSHGMMGINNLMGTNTPLKYWGESDMSKTLGYEETLGDDESFKDAYRHFTKELGLTHEEAMERLQQMGYDPKLPDDKIRLVENPTKFMGEYIESILSKRNISNDIVNKNRELDETEINPIILRQIKSLKNSLENNDLSINDIIKYLK